MVSFGRLQTINSSSQLGYPIEIHLLFEAADVYYIIEMICIIENATHTHTHKMLVDLIIIINIILWSGMLVVQQNQTKVRIGLGLRLLARLLLQRLPDARHKSSIRLVCESSHIELNFSHCMRFEQFGAFCGQINLSFAHYLDHRNLSQSCGSHI